MIKKAVIPAAGFGTRMLPATKSIAKEMVPVAGKPTIQYVVEEAVEAGITEILIVIGKGKQSIQEHFHKNLELELELEAKQKTKLLKQVRSLNSLANIHFIWQKELKGLGDAISYSKHFVANESFAVLLGDTITKTSNGGSLTAQLCQQAGKTNSSVVAVQEVSPKLVHRYGIIGGEEVKPNLFKANILIEKPSIDEAPSNLAFASRYVFKPQIFDALSKTVPGKNNEIQLTDAMSILMQNQDLYAYKFDGKRYDVGNTLDFIKTNISLALEQDELGPQLAAWLKNLPLTI